MQAMSITNMNSHQSTCSTGSAGFIQTIKAFSKPSLPAAIVGTVATVGWIVQGLGLAFYFRQVSLRSSFLII